MVGIAAFVGQLVFGIGNSMGTGLGINMIFPNVDVKTGAVIMTVVCIAILLLKELYMKLETFRNI